MASKKRPPPRYKTQDTGKRGSPEQWARLAQAVALKGDNALAILGLTQMPRTVDELRQARRKAMALAHPDKGHEAERAVKINDAFTKLLKVIAPPAPAVAALPIGLQHPARCTGTLPADLDDPRWAFDIKPDGERFLFYLGFNPFGGSARNTFLSRTKSKVDGNYVDRTANVPHLAAQEYGLDGTILDGELFHTDLSTTQSIMGSSPEVAHAKQVELGPVTFHVFDILFFKGEDVRRKPLRERRRLMLEVVAGMANAYIGPIEQRTGFGIQQWFDEVVAAGGEGLVGKRLDAPYGVDWAKLKKSIDVSCVITGWRAGKAAFAGLIGSLQVSVYHKGKLMELGYVSGMDNALREDMTQNFDSKYLGKAVDVIAMELRASGTFREAVFDRMRFDILPEDCTLDRLKEAARIIKARRS